MDKLRSRMESIRGSGMQMAGGCDIIGKRSLLGLEPHDCNIGVGWNVDRRYKKKEEN